MFTRGAAPKPWTLPINFSSHILVQMSSESIECAVEKCGVQQLCYKCARPKQQVESMKKLIQVRTRFRDRVDGANHISMLDVCCVTGRASFPDHAGIFCIHQIPKDMARESRSYSLGGKLFLVNPSPVYRTKKRKFF